MAITSGEERPLSFRRIRRVGDEAAADAIRSDFNVCRGAATNNGVAAGELAVDRISHAGSRLFPAAASVLCRDRAG